MAGAAASRRGHGERLVESTRPGRGGRGAARLRAGDPPVVARAERGRVVLDLRTVPPEQDGLVADALAAALAAGR